MSVRKQHNSGFKAQVALEAMRNQRTIAEIASEYTYPRKLDHKLRWILRYNKYPIPYTCGGNICQ